MAEFLGEALALRDRREEDAISPHGLAVARGRLEKRLDRWLEGKRSHPGNHQFQKHLLGHREEILTFLYEPHPEATNWPAEQAIRPLVVNRKVFGGNRTAAGLQVACHANGDREIDMVLDAIEKALQKLPRQDHRHRIEHVSVVNPGILDRVKRLGVVLVLHAYLYEFGATMEEYGARRWPMMHAARSSLEMGIAVAGHSDWPVSAADPLLRIQSIVTRQSAEGKVYGSEQKVSMETAPAIWTRGNAYACFDEDIKGSIEAGKPADFAILSQDPTQVPPDIFLRVLHVLRGFEITPRCS